MFLMIVFCRFPRRWTVVNILIIIAYILGVVLTASLHIDTSSNLNHFCHWGYFIFPGILLATKFLHTFIAISRYAYIYWDNICRLCNNFTKITISTVLISCMVILPYLLAKLWHGNEDTTLLISCSNGTQDLYVTGLNDYFNHTLNDDSVFTRDNPSIYVFFGSYYIILFLSIILDTIFYFQIIRYIRKSATQVAVISVTPTERKRGRNIITAPANLLICLITIGCIIPSVLLQTKFLLGIGEDHSSFKGYHYVTVFCLSILIPLLTIGSSADLRQDIITLREILFHKCNKQVNENCTDGSGQQIHANVELALHPGGERAGIYAISENTTDPWGYPT